MEEASSFSVEKECSELSRKTAGLFRTLTMSLKQH